MWQPGWEGSLRENGSNVYIQLSPSAVHLKLSQQCLLISYSLIQNKKLKKNSDKQINETHYSLNNLVSSLPFSIHSVSGDPFHTQPALGKPGSWNVSELEPPWVLQLHQASWSISTSWVLWGRGSKYTQASFLPTVIDSLGTILVSWLLLFTIRVFLFSDCSKRAQ